MPRPKRLRRIMARPRVDTFGPEQARSAGDVDLTLEEFEAVRLIDYEGMDQSQAAEIMDVSRQTVGRILKSGRSKVARALVEGLSLRVGGGCYRMGGRGPGKGRGCGRGRRHDRGMPKERR